MKTWILKRGLPAAAVVAVGLVAALTTVRRVRASDHQDTPEVELSPRYDVNDVYAFPAATPGRIALVLGTSSPITPANTPSFTFGTKDKELYQIKVDNNRDGIEDLVFQITFTGPAGHQRVTVHGPIAPNQTGPANTLIGEERLCRGRSIRSLARRTAFKSSPVRGTIRSSSISSSFSGSSRIVARCPDRCRSYRGHRARPRSARRAKRSTTSAASMIWRS